MIPKVDADIFLEVREIALSGPEQLLKVVEENLSIIGIAVNQNSELKLQFLENDKLRKEEISIKTENSSISVEAADYQSLCLGASSVLQSLFYKKSLNLNESPAFRWRGAMLDCCRHFFPLEEVKRFINLLFLHRFNVFHWHLTEDQGWRIQIDKYPLLTELSSWRREDDGSIYGGYYSREEIREVIQFAADRGIDVVPEIEMPGHCQEVFKAYPELSCKGEKLETATTWGVFDDVFCAGNDEVFTFLKNVLDEVIDLFPSEYIHIGGDECPKVRWEECPKCRQCMKDFELKDTDELQSWFIRQIDNYLQQKGKKLLGWDEILEGGLAKNATVLSWRGEEGAIEAAKLGHEAIMCPMKHCYLDWKNFDSEEEPGRLGVLELEQVYAFNPVPEELPEEAAKFIIGGQGNIWTEGIPDRETLDILTWPRLAALSEVLWCGAGDDWPEFKKRVKKHLEFLDLYGVNSYKHFERWDRG